MTKDFIKISIEKQNRFRYENKIISFTGYAIDLAKYCSKIVKLEVEGATLTINYKNLKHKLGTNTTQQDTVIKLTITSSQLIFSSK